VPVRSHSPAPAPSPQVAGETPGPAPPAPCLPGEGPTPHPPPAPRSLERRPRARAGAASVGASVATCEVVSVMRRWPARQARRRPGQQAGRPAAATSTPAPRERAGCSSSTGRDVNQGGEAIEPRPAGRRPRGEKRSSTPRPPSERPHRRERPHVVQGSTPSTVPGPFPGAPASGRRAARRPSAPPAGRRELPESSPRSGPRSGAAMRRRRPPLPRRPGSSRSRPGPKGRTRGRVKTWLRRGSRKPSGTATALPGMPHAAAAAGCPAPEAPVPGPPARAQDAAAASRGIQFA